jgi:uncharacterized protein (DUF2147 family)
MSLPRLLLALLLAFAAGTARDDGPGDTILGLWLVESKDAVVEIRRSGDIYSGTLVWLQDTVYSADDGPDLVGKPITDLKNPDPQRRHRPLLGLTLLEGLRFDGVDHWGGGRIYNSDDGRTYHCQLYMPSRDQIKLRGYVGIALFGGSTAWTRLEHLPP